MKQFLLEPASWSNKHYVTVKTWTTVVSFKTDGLVSHE